MKLKRTAVLFLIFCLTAVVLMVPAGAAPEDEDTTTATVTFTTGRNPEDPDLYFVKVPVFDFGSQIMSIKDEEYDVTGSADDKVLTVEDLRNTGAGWNVVAEITSSFTGIDSGADLTGSQIVIKGGTIVYDADVATPPAAPTQEAVITLANSGGQVAVLKATTGQGKGRWKDTLGEVKLEVPGTIARAEAYTATITWTLNDGPV